MAGLLLTILAIAGVIAYTLLREPTHKEIHYNLSGQTVSFIALGDQGTGNYRQYQVATGMEHLAATKAVDFVMLLGDNFYRYGIESVADPQWLYKFENMYRGKSLDHVPFYAVLGNHDYGGNEQAEIEYGRERKGSGRWHMPAKDYVEYYGEYHGDYDSAYDDEVDSKALLKVIYLDTSPLAREHADTIRKLTTLLEQSQPARWTLVASHVPIRTSSPHYYDQALVDLMVPVLKQYSVDGYLSGHDHNQQLISREGEPLFIVAGTGGKHGDPLQDGFEPALEFQSLALGFVYSVVSRDTLEIEFYNNNKKLYATKISHRSIKG